MSSIELGHKVRDKVTGYTGIVAGRADYLSGCNQALVLPRVHEDGTGHEGRWFDLQRLEILDYGNRIVLDNGATPGADLPAPIR